MNNSIITEELKSLDTNTIIDIIEELKGTDGFFTAVVIHNRKIEAFLQKHEIIDTNIRGGSCPGKYYDSFADLIDEIVYGEK